MLFVSDLLMFCGAIVHFITNGHSFGMQLLNSEKALSDVLNSIEEVFLYNRPA